MEKTFCKYFLAMIVFAMSIGFSACGSDDDDDSTGKSTESAAATLAGTYKGRLDTWSADTYTQNYFDVILTVTDLKNGKIRVSANKGNATPKEIEAKWNGENYIVGSDTQGSLTYDVASKIFSVATKQTAETDIEMVFEGIKQ